MGVLVVVLIVLASLVASGTVFSCHLFEKEDECDQALWKIGRG